jgi:hypothetical protein
MPEIPGHGLIDRGDQHLLGLAEELVTFSEAMRDHCGENRIQQAYSSLEEVLACCLQLMRGLPHFAAVRMNSEGNELGDATEQPVNPFITSSVAPWEKAYSYSEEGKTEAAYQELGDVMDSCIDALQAFTFKVPNESTQ